MPIELPGPAAVTGNNRGHFDSQQDVSAAPTE